MDENLRVALIQFLNQMGEAPDPKGIVMLMHDSVSTFMRFLDPDGGLQVADYDVSDLLQFLLTYQVT